MASRPPLMRRLLAVLVLPAVLLGAVALHGAHSAKAGEHFLWRVAGETNSVYLLGSIHALRPSDYPLADVIGEAFRDAEALVLEIRLPPGGTGTVAAAMGGTPGTRLVDQLSPEQYRRARELARAQGIDLASLSDLDPWLAGLVIMQGSLRRAGYRPGTGIDAHFQRKAVAAGKPILSLETARDQLQLFDALPREMQGDFLIRTLQEAAGLEDSLAKLVTAWKAGDVATVRDLVLAEFEPYPDLYERLVVQRNRNWLPQLESFLDDRRDYLVVVGAAHMLGEQGLVRMLERRGYHVMQR